MKTLTFNNQIMPDWLWITKTPLQLAPPIEWQYSEIKGRIGAVAVKPKIKARPLPFEVAIMADDEIDLKQKAEYLASLLFTTEPKELTYSDEPGRVYMAVWDQPEDFEKTFETGEGRILFVVPGGLKESNEKTSGPFTGSKTIEIGGSYETNPIVTATFSGASTNYKIALNNGEYVRVIRNFAAGEILVIDFETELISLNGAAIMPALDWVNSDFFTLNPGNNTLTVTATNQTTEVKYKEKWL